MDKKAYQEKLEAQLKIWRADFDKLKAQGEKKSAETKISYQEKIDEIETKSQQLRDKLATLKDTGGETLQNVKTELDEGISELNQQLKDIFSKK